MIKRFIINMSVLFALTIGLCFAGPKFFNIPEQTMTGSNTITFDARGTKPFYLTSVTLTYPGGGGAGTTFQVNHLDVHTDQTITTNILLRITATNTFDTLTAYFIGHKYITRNDSLVATSTDASTAKLKYDAEMATN